MKDKETESTFNRRYEDRMPERRKKPHHETDHENLGESLEKAFDTSINEDDKGPLKK